MGDRVDEAVMLLIAANFAHQKNRIEDKAGDDSAKENDAEKHTDAFAPVEDDPSAADRERHRRQRNPQREEKVDGFLAADDAHRRILIISRRDAEVRREILEKEKPESILRFLSVSAMK